MKKKRKENGAGGCTFVQLIHQVKYNIFFERVIIFIKETIFFQKIHMDFTEFVRKNSILTHILGNLTRNLRFLEEKVFEKKKIVME